VVPYGERHDEVGALARSIEVFQQTMRKNEEPYGLEFIWISGLLSALPAPLPTRWD
jgi:hypothetical protein